MLKSYFIELYPLKTQPLFLASTARDQIYSLSWGNPQIALQENSPGVHTLPHYRFFVNEKEGGFERVFFLGINKELKFLLHLI